MADEAIVKDEKPIEEQKKESTDNTLSIYQAQIDTLAKKVTDLNNELAMTKVALTNKDIELNSMKAVVDSSIQTTKKDIDYTDIIPDSELSSALMSGKY